MGTQRNVQTLYNDQAGLLTASRDVKHHDSVPTTVTGVSRYEYLETAGKYLDFQAS